MSTSLVGDLTDVFKSPALGEAAANLGESEGSVLRGFQTASAAILGGLAGNVGQSGLMKQVFDLVTGPFTDSKILDNVRSYFSGSSASAASAAGGTQLLSTLFGGDQSRVTEKISQAAGLRPSSAATLMSMAAPVVLGLLGRRVQEGHLDASGLSSLIQREFTGIRGWLPAGLNNLLGTAPVAPVIEAGKGIAKPERSVGWVWPILGLLALVAGLLWLFGRTRDQVTPVVRTTAGPVQSPAVGLGDFIRTALVSGVELNIPRNGTEARLLDFIKDPARIVDNTTWFDFDRLSFDANSAVLREDSQEQLGNIDAILKAYPNLHLKIGGYTDNTGDASANLALSQARADSVRQQLISKGTAANRLEAQGYGDQYPIGDNTTEEGRARNRRISLRVTQK